MKVSKKGRLKIERRDYRQGNFVFTKEESHIKVQDINSTVSFRINTNVVAGRMLGIMIDNAKDGDKNSSQYLENYVVMMYNLLCSVHDVELMQAVMDATIACINRHKEVYGIKEDISKEEDDGILEDVKGVAEAEEELRKEVEG